MADDHSNEDVGLGADRPPAEDEDICLAADDIEEVDDDDVGRCLEGGKGGAGTREGSDSGVEANEGGCERAGNGDGYNSGLESLASDHIAASCESSLISYSGLEGSNRDEEEEEAELEEEEAGGLGALDVTLTERSPSPDEVATGKGRCSSEEGDLKTSVTGGPRRGAGGPRGVAQRYVNGRGDRSRRPESPGAKAPPGAPRSRPTAPRPPRTPGSVGTPLSNGDGDRSTSRTSSSSSGCTRSTSRRGVAPTSSATQSSRGTPQSAGRGARGNSRGPSSSVERGATAGTNTPVSSRSSGTSEVRRGASLRESSLSSRKGRPPATPSSTPTSARDYKRPTTEDDGRWPSSSIRSRRLGAEQDQRLRRTPSANRETKGAPPSLESKATALEKYATLPRRRNETKRGTLASVLAAATVVTTPAKPPSSGGSSSTLGPSSGRSVSVSREPSLNRAASLRRQRVAATAAASSALTSSITSASGGYRSDADDGSGGRVRGRPGREKSLPAYPRRRRPVTIYHEASVQTTLTKRDVERALLDSKESRKARRKTTGSIVTSTTSCDCEVQACETEVSKADAATCTEETLDSTVSKEDLQSLEAERQLLSEQLKKLSEAHTRLEEEYMRQSQRLSELEGEQGILAAEKTEAERKLKDSMRRVALLLHGSTAEPTPRGSTPPGPPEVTINGGDGDSSLDELERHLLASGQVLSNQQHEIGGLQKICRNLQKDLDKSLGIQKVLKRQLHEMESESAEMQEFLQAEKSTLADTLRDSEAEMRILRESLSRQEEECKHLVRISEQRRQENLALQARLTGVERRGRELLLQQGAAVSGASVALSGLSSRLDGLVEQLVTGYGISEQELEDVIFHNEAYTQNSSVEASPEKKRSSSTSTESQGEGSQQATTLGANVHPRPSRPPHRRSPASPGAGASFVSAVISAIKSAASPFSYRTSTTVPQDVSSSSEPSMTPAHEADNSEIAAELSEDLSDLPPARLAGSESLQNLSRAIMQRQVTENEEEEDSLPLSPPHTSPLSSSSSPSDATAEERERRREREEERGKGEGRSTLTPPPNSGADSLVDQVIEVDNLLTKLLKVLRIIQMENDSYLDEMQEERAQLSDKVHMEEDKNKKVQEQLQGWDQMGARLRSELSDALSMLCKRTKELEEARMQLTKLQEEAYLPDRLNEQDHVNELSKKYAVSNKLLADNWRQALTEVRRQYVAIDNALETLHSVQGVVLQCPPLTKLQQDLEEANFLSVSSPVIGLETDPNANASVPSAISPNSSDSQENGIKEEGLNGRV